MRVRHTMTENDPTNGRIEAAELFTRASELPADNFRARTLAQKLGTEGAITHSVPCDRCGRDTYAFERFCHFCGRDRWDR